MNVPPEGPAVKSAKAGRSQAHTSAQIEHDEAMGQGPHFEDDLPHVILAEITAFHPFPYRLGHQIGGGGTACLEVLWIAASAFARLEEHEFEEPWILEGVLQVDLPHLREPLLNAAGEAFAGQPSC